MAKTVLRSAMTPVLGVIMRVVCVTLDVSLAGWATSAIKVLFLPVIKLIIIITRYMIVTSPELFIKKGHKKNQTTVFFKKYVCQLHNMQLKRCTILVKLNALLIKTVLLYTFVSVVRNNRYINILLQVQYVLKYK